MKEAVQTNIKDEIDLSELVQVIWINKLFIILISLLTTFISLLYVTFHKPLYDAKMSLISPIYSDLTAINYGRNSITRLKPLSPADGYIVFRAALFAQSTLDDFKSNKAKITHSLFQQNVPTITVKAEPLGYGVIATAQSPETAAIAVQNYVNLAEKIALDKLNEALNKEVTFVKARLTDEINSLREQVKTEREEQLFRLQDALNLAESAGFEQPNVASKAINNPAYLRGSKALKAEIASLKQRQSNDLQSPQLTSALREYNALNEFHFDENDVFLVRLDGKMIVKPQSFNAMRIILASAVLGLMFGMMLITLRHMKQIT